ncbi:MAG: polysaccharide deacetylase family protein, partial [Nitrosopumilaceae archaeon]
NKYYDGKFIKFDISSYNGDNFSTDILKQKSNNPIIISFDNSIPIDQIDRFISSVKSRSTLFINTSDLVGFNLTIRSESA